MTTNSNDYDEHKLTISELCLRLGTSRDNGLTKEEAERRLVINGPNVLDHQKKTNELLRFSKALSSGFSILLWLGAGLSLGLYMFEENGDSDELTLAGALICVVFVTGVFSYHQEGKSMKTMKSFMDLIPDRAEAIREGEVVELLAQQVVVGDVLILKKGEKISADVRIIESTFLKTDHSSLTGESEPLDRTKECTSPNAMETANLAFFGTYVVEGEGKGIVIRTGNQTLFGGIANLATNISENPTIIAKEIHRLTIIVVAWATMTGSIFFAIVMSIGYQWKLAVEFFIGIVIVSIPEGLMATLTLSLTLAANRMAAKNCLVKKLEAVEALGNTSVICTDKTGTLTQNMMSVSHLWFNNSFHDMQIGFQKKERLSLCFQALSRCASLCSKAEFRQVQDKYVAVGDPTEAAILRCKNITTKDEIKMIRRQYRKIFEVPFNSNNKFQLSVHKDDVGKKKHILVMKGAPERILSYCSYILLETGVADLTDELFSNISDACSIPAASGERVLAFCDIEPFDYGKQKFVAPQTGFRFLGLITLIDPPRPNVPEAVLTCRLAGIKVIMVTGDHPLTAQAIAKQVNIISDDLNIDVLGHKPRVSVLDGTDLLKMTNDQLDNLIENHDELIFARTDPKQKFEIVKSCQRLGAIVAVTGDGVNDCPALRQADIGVAMGKGSAVARESADIILVDDNFATIAVGIEQGRLVFKNLKKSVVYTLTHAMPQLFLFIAHFLVGIPMPLGILAVLCIDVGIDLWPSIALAYEPPETNIMAQPPRNVKRDRLFNTSLINLALQMGAWELSAGVFAYFIVMAQHGWFLENLVGIQNNWGEENMLLPDYYGTYWSPKERRDLEHSCYSAVLVAIVVTQTANAMCVRKSGEFAFKKMLSNGHLISAIIFSIFLASFIVYTPILSEMLHLGTMKPHWWLLSLPFWFAIVLYDCLRKWIIRRYPQGWIARNTIP